ncbi:MAG: hypothetical protein LUD15_11875 [Bacteroides sp.]|nr:hypothetical protein [Bacteroides sp.]
MKQTLLTLIALATLLPLSAQQNEQTEDNRLNEIIPMALERVRFSGYGQAVYYYSDEKGLDSSNSFDIKRLMFTAYARLTGKWNVFFLYDFGARSKMNEYWTEYTFLPWLKVRVEQFKVLITIENLLSPSTLQIINGAQSVNYISGFDSSDDLYGAPEAGIWELCFPET